MEEAEEHAADTGEFGNLAGDLQIAIRVLLEAIPSVQHQDLMQQIRDRIEAGDG